MKVLDFEGMSSSRRKPINPLGKIGFFFLGIVDFVLNFIHEILDVIHSLLQCQ
jgi:hypothetical protein